VDVRLRRQLAGLILLLLWSCQGMGCSPAETFALDVHLVSPPDQQPLDEVDVIELTIEYEDGTDYPFYWEPGDPSTWVLEGIPDVALGERAVLDFRGLMTDPADPHNVLEIANGRSTPVSLGIAGEIHVYFSRRGRFGRVESELPSCRAEPQLTSVPGRGAVVLGGRTCDDPAEPVAGILSFTQRDDGLYEITMVDDLYHRLGATLIRVEAEESTYSGQVLVAGGWENAVGGGDIVAKLDRYDPRNHTHSTVSSLPTALAEPQATALEDGTWLLTGGLVPWGGNPEIHGRYVTLNPVSGDATDRGPMQTPRYGHRSILAQDGGVVVCGGYRSGAVWDRTTDECEVYQDGSGSSMASMTVDRGNFGLAAFPGGMVAFGGSSQPEGEEPTALDTAEIYDPEGETWSPLSTLMTVARDRVQAVTLPDGRVMACGGLGPEGEPLSSCEVFDPATLAFAPLPEAVVPGGRSDFGLVALDSGLVLLVGGEGEEAAVSYLYNP